MGLEAHLPRIEAQRALERLAVTPGVTVPSDHYFDLVFLATEDRDQAERQTRAYIAAQLRANITPT